MARKMSFGKILRDARHRKHLDITTAAARLRIRTDILQAIEDEDFSRMPPHGYTRNMIGAYARLLGLNGSDITRLYLDEAYAIEVGKARNDTTRSLGDRRARGEGRGRSDRREAVEERANARRQRRSENPNRPVRSGANGREIYDDRPQRVYATDRVHPTSHSPMPTTQYTNFYAGPNYSDSRGRLPFIVAGIVILIVIAIILFFVFRPQDNANQELPNVPIAGVTDTSDAETSAPPEPVAPTQVAFTYDIASGQSSYIEIYEDGSTTPIEAGTITGPASKTYDVTGTLEFVTANPTPVTLKVDGNKVKMTDEDGDGVFTYTVDFATILQEWLAEHGKTADDESADESGTDDQSADESGTDDQSADDADIASGDASADGGDTSSTSSDGSSGSSSGTISPKRSSSSST